MSAYTPGPWHIAHLLSADCYDKGFVVKSPNGPHEYPFEIAAVPPSPNAEADARLIAAAPDLLEALKDARAALRLADDELVPSASIALDRVDAAIAKAEGR